jgi:hypothetical protein
MKHCHLILLATLLFSSAILAHEGVELGPNGGRILEFSKDETLHGEVTVKDGKFSIALFDKDMKPVALNAQSLTATTGERDAPVKLEVSKAPQGFTVPAIEPGAWLILQYKNSPDTKAITARFEYNTKTCEECQAPEWLCKCAPADEKTRK